MDIKRRIKNRDYNKEFLFSKLIYDKVHIEVNKIDIIDSKYRTYTIKSGRET